MSRAALCALATILAVGVAGAGSTARAWEPVVGNRESAPRWSGRAIYRVNERGSQDMDLNVLLAEIHKGMFEWTTPDCTSARVRYDGLTTDLPSDASVPGADNVIAFRESSWSHGAQAVAITAPSFITTGSGPPVIVAATMWLNGQHWTWVTGPSEGRRINLLSVVLHEAGHYFGLGHSPVPMSVMNEQYSQDVTGLAADDVEGICSLYPLGQAGNCAAQPCPDGYTQVADNCLWEGDGAPPACQDGGSSAAPGRCDAAPCEDVAVGCTVDGDCASSDERCIAGRCTPVLDPPPPMCTRASQCAAGEACRAGLCVAVDPTQPPGLPVGSDCVVDGDCASGLCRFTGDATQCTAFCETDGDCAGAAPHCARDGTQTGLCGSEVPTSDGGPREPPTSTYAGGGCSTVPTSGPTTRSFWLVVPYVLLNRRRVRRRLNRPEFLERHE